MNILKEIVVGVMSFLQSTFESGEDGWLPTLDTSLRMTQDNIIEYRYYERFGEEEIL